MPVVSGRSRIDEVSPIITHEAGAGPRVNKTDTMRPREACARDAAVETPNDAAIPRHTSNTALNPEPQR